MMTLYDAIIEALKLLDGLGSTDEVYNKIVTNFGNLWGRNSISTTMADMVSLRFGGNKSSTVPQSFRVLKRVARKTYCLTGKESANSGVDSPVSIQEKKKHECSEGSEIELPQRYCVNSARDSFAVWSTERLKFDNKPKWQEDMCDEINSAIQRFDFKPDRVLHAIYSSTIKKQPQHARVAWDLDNILFYNVDQNYFSSLNISGFEFEYSLSDPPKPPHELKGSELHYHSYECTRKDNTNFKSWMPTRKLAKFRTVIPYNATEKIEGCHMWLYLKHGEIELFDVPQRRPHRFGIKITLRAEKNLVSKLFKQIIDGTVGLFQTFGGPGEDEVTNRLATDLEMDRSGVLALLKDHSKAILGETKLFKVFPKYVQMNPSDEFLYAGRLVYEKWDKDFIEISGELFDIGETTKIDAAF